jgi:hypothetical protein
MDGTVTVLDSAHRQVGSQKTRHGRFSFALAPGSYTLSARTGGDLREQRTVAVRAHQTTHVILTIAVP